jgi:hypothetical protein
MSDRVANAGAVLIASIGMAFAALGLVGVDPSLTAHHQHPTNETSIECKQ